MWLLCCACVLRTARSGSCRSGCGRCVVRPLSFGTWATFASAVRYLLVSSVCLSVCLSVWLCLCCGIVSYAVLTPRSVISLQRWWKNRFLQIEAWVQLLMMQWDRVERRMLDEERTFKIQQQIDRSGIKTAAAAAPATPAKGNEHTALFCVSLYCS